MKRHWRRLAVQFAILGAMTALYTVSDRLFSAVISLALVIIPTATWTVFGVLLWLSSKAPEIETLRERTDDALSAALGSTAAAVVGAIVLLRIAGVITVSVAPVVSIGLAFVVVTVSIPSLLFVRTAVRVWLPMVRASQDHVVTKEVEHKHEARMDAMEGRLTDLIDANTAISQQASDHADKAYQEANSVNDKIADQGAIIITQGDQIAIDGEVGRDTNVKVTEIRDRDTTSGS